MLGNFTYCNPTKLYFGEDSLSNLKTELKKYGTNVVLVYGGGSIKKNGIYDQVMAILNEEGKNVAEIAGVMPNPTVEKLYEGVEIARKHNVDILLAVNFFVNLLLLSLVGGRCRCSRGRLVLAACVGALSSLHIFLPPLPVWAGTALGVLLKIGWGAAMVRIAFGWQGWYSLIKRWLLLLGCGWAFFGLMQQLRGCYAGKGMFVFDNALYFHIRTPVFILCLAGAYLVVWSIGALLRLTCPKESLCSAVLEVDGQQLRLDALIDSGNSLVEPFSGLPVAVCSLSVAAKLLSAELLSAMLCGQGNQLHRVRQIPFCAVGQSGLLPAVKGERLTICCESQAPKVSEAFYLAVTQQPIGGEEWQLLLSPGLVDAATAAAADKTMKAAGVVRHTDGGRHSPCHHR